MMISHFVNPMTGSLGKLESVPQITWLGEKVFQHPVAFKSKLFATNRLDLNTEPQNHIYDSKICT